MGRHFALPLLCLVALAGQISLAQQSHDLPWSGMSLTATEEFHLRGECAKLAAKIETDNPDDDSDETVSWSSNYSGKYNRCYVRSSSYNSRLNLTISFLYDGQTGETLASVESDLKEGRYVGVIYGSDTLIRHAGCEDPSIATDSDCTWRVALKYIDEHMRRDDSPTLTPAPPFDPNAPYQSAPPASTAASDVSAFGGRLVTPLSAPATSAPARRPRPQPAPHRSDIPTIAKAANGAVVSIIMSDKDGNPEALGTGFLISKDGRILTNYHVIANGSSAIAKLPDGSVFPVDGVLAADKLRDVALIKAQGDNFHTLILGNSDHVEVGQEVVAIGNPLSLESTVSNGIVSGMRSVKEEGGDFLQITAPISPGSSGGPLFNMDGQVIGITTMHLKGGENLNFAIPINDVKRLIFTDSLELHKLPNEPESASEETGSSTADEAPNAQINSPAYESYLELLKSGDRTLKDGTYACFDDDPKSSNTFTVITADLSQGKYMQVMTENFGNGVSTGAGKAFYGQLNPYSGGKQGLFATLPTMNPSDQGDVFEWGPDVLTMRHVIGTRSSYEFNMQRSTGRYTEQIVLGDDPSNPPSTIERAGRCIRIPNDRQTPEEEYQSRK